ncbi:PC-Esterase [Cynara cardunculus var. scolymus]|uniref:PC-Esterase n=1 Tax=Cynara cardunculus var. scolymus TaxID=59895 RepID=A0A103XPS9_CYNCS|nr:PC-Esterase [Cynara cardunculus var. scolymus]
MAESAKYTPVNGGSHVVSDFKFTKLFSFRTKRTRAFAYVFIAVFVGFTVFLAFNPSSNPSSPWFSNIFTGSSFRISSSSSSSTGIQANGTYSSSSDSDGSIGSYFSSIYSYFFPSNSSHSTQNSTIYTFSWNTSVSGSSSANNKAPTVNNDPPVARNQTPSESVGAKVEAVKANQTTITSLPSQSASNQTTRTQSSETLKNSTKIGDKSRSETPKSTSENGKGSVNSTSSLDYNCTVEFFVAPFIVRESETKDKNGAKKETLRLDLVGTSADQYKSADIVVFNTGHWWTHEKTAKGEENFAGKIIIKKGAMSIVSLTGGQWNSGGQCDNEVEPIKNTTYLTPYPDKMKVLEKVLRGMKTRVSYLNITRLTDFRKDGHPSIYRKKHYTDEERRSPLHFQDCSHWCLPGVPDAWNEILYAELLAKQQQKH